MKLSILISSLALLTPFATAAVLPPTTISDLVARHGPGEESAEKAVPKAQCEDLKKAYHQYNGDVKKIAKNMHVSEATAKSYIHEAKEHDSVKKEGKCYL